MHTLSVSNRVGRGLLLAGVAAVGLLECVPAIAQTTPVLDPSAPSASDAQHTAEQRSSKGRTDTTPTGAAEAASTAPAQGSDPLQPQTDIVVTGIRRANQVALEAKRNAVNILDAIGTTEARALPDTTVVESLRRIPGLSVIPVTDNEHPQDEAITPIIRGLGPAYNNVTIDGLPVASPGTPNGIIGSIQRGVRLDILPTSMISQLQVVKSFTPDLDPNAIGGAVNIVTRSAFEGGGKPFFTGEAAVGHATDVSKPRDQKDPGYRFVATASSTFGPDSIFGATLSANYQKISSYTEEHATADTIFYNFYNAAGQLQTGANLGNGYAVPQEDRYWYAQNDRKRYGVIGKLEAKPSDQFEAFVTGGYYYFKDHYQRNEQYFTIRGNTTVQNQTPTSGTFAGGLGQVGFIDDNTISKTSVIQAGLNWRPGDKHHFSVNASGSRATYDENYLMLKYGTNVVRPAPGSAGITQPISSLFAINYDTSKFNQVFNVDLNQYNNPQDEQLIYYRPFVHRVAKDTIVTGRFDYDFNRGKDDQGLGFIAGISYTVDRPRYGIDRADYEPNNTGPVLTLAGALGPSAPEQYAGRNILTIDPVAALNQFNSLPMSAYNAPDQTAFNNQDDFTHKEKTLGAYAAVSFRNDDLNGEAGVHYDNTRQSTVGRLLQGGVFRDIPTSSKYHYFLPSAVGTWHTTRSLDVRGAFSQTIGRPSYDSYAARSSVTFANASDQGNANAANVNVTVGNPDLKPRKSTNYDVSIEWTPSHQYGGIIALAGFYKDISNEIFTSGSLGYTYQGVTYVNAQVRRPENSSSSTIKGVELNAIINSIGFIHSVLSGFGASVNFSLLDGKLKIPMTGGATRSVGYLVGQSDKAINASLFYSQNGLELRAAFNHQGRALRDVPNADIYWQDLYYAPRNQLDLSASYTLSNGLAIFAQAANVTHSKAISLGGPNRDLLRNSYTVPTTIWAGIRFTPKLR